MNKVDWRKISYFLLFVLGVVYLYFYHSRLFVLKNVAFKDLLIITLLSVATFFSLAFQFKYSIAIFSLSLKFKEWFGLTVVNTMISYYTPARGGLVARAYYLNDRYNLSYSKYMSLLSGSYVINFVVASLGVILFSLMTGLRSGYWDQKILVLGAGFLVGSIALVFLLIGLCRRTTSFRPGRIGNALNKFVEGIELFRRSPTQVVKVFFLQFCVIVVMGGKLYWSFRSLGNDVAFIDVLVVQSLVVFSMLISITPGNLGVKEGVIGLLATQLHVSFGDAILAASVDRGVSMCVTFLLGVGYSKILFRRSRSEERSG